MRINPFRGGRPNSPEGFPTPRIEKSKQPQNPEGSKEKGRTGKFFGGAIERARGIFDGPKPPPVLNNPEPVLKDLATGSIFSQTEVKTEDSQGGQPISSEKLDVQPVDLPKPSTPNEQEAQVASLGTKSEEMVVDKMPKAEEPVPGDVAIKEGTTVSNEEVTQVLQEVNKAPKPRTDTKKEIPWTVEDVIDLSKEAREGGQATAFTADPHVKDGVLNLNFSWGDTTLSFKTSDPGYFNRIANAEDGISVDVVTSPDGESTVVVHSKYGSSALRDTLQHRGYKDVLKDTLIPDTLTEEYANELISNGQVEIGKRKIPIQFAASEQDLLSQTASLPQNKDNMYVYHGGSLTRGLSIAQVGLFAEGEHYTRPILSDRPNTLSLKLAKDEWEDSYPRADPSGYGAIVIFKVSPDELVDRGDGFDGKLLQPKETTFLDSNEKWRLFRKTKGNALRVSSNNPGYLSPGHIAEIILVQQTKHVRNNDAFDFSKIP